MSQPNIPFSCAGWESDPQSFSKRIAENFLKDAFNTSVPAVPDSINCSGAVCTVHYNNFPFPFDIMVDISQVPGVVTASGSPFFAFRRQICSYSYSCDFTGSISFTRIACRFI
jgi:hypothetical protein